MSIEAFTLNGTTTTLSATTSAPTPSTLVPTPEGRIRVYNAGTATVFIRSGIGDADGTATTNHTPLTPGGVEVFSIPPNHNRISAIASSGTATVYVTVGSGI